MCSATLQAGQSLGAGQTLTNCKGNVTLAMQGDGNLVVYGPPGALWSSNTAGTPANVAVMQGDGNFVLYSGSTPYWSSNTAGYSGAYLVVQDDGNVVIYAGSTAVWSTGTCCY
ncbi:MAG: lectin [Polyangiaceae bacterium]|nr:lectin [Polyangiaceae bacterium]